MDRWIDYWFQNVLWQKAAFQGQNGAIGLAGPTGPQGERVSDFITKELRWFYQIIYTLIVHYHNFNKYFLTFSKKMQSSELLLAICLCFSKQIEILSTYDP